MASPWPVAPDLALDLGTGLTRLASRGGGPLIERPTSLGPTSSRGALALEACPERPVEHGVVVDVPAAARLLAPCLRLGHAASARPRVLVCHPSDASATERERLVEAAVLAGASAVALVPEPVAAARASARPGAVELRPELVLDLGEGVTDVAVVQGGRVLAGAAFRRGLAELRDELRQAVLDEHDVLLQEAEAAALLLAAGQRPEGPGWLAVDRLASRREQERGRRVLRRVLLVRSEVVVRVLARAADEISGAARGLLAGLGRRERAGLTRAGALAGGGGALIAPLRDAVGRRLGLGLRLPPRPLHAVVLGARALLETGPRPEWRTA